MSTSKKPDPAFAIPCPKCGAKAGAKCTNYLGKGKFTCKERKIDERLKHDCPRCGARAGFPCVDFKGRPLAEDNMREPMCQERGRPHITASKLQRTADQKNARLLAGYGGDNTLLTYLHDGADNLLAAEGVEKFTPEILAAQNLAAIRKGVEDGGAAEWGLKHAFNWITLHEIRRVAARLIGAEWAEALWAYCERTYRNSQDYYHTTFCSALTRADHRLTLAFVVRDDPALASQYNPEGRRIIPTKTWPPEGYQPPMTYPEFDARFPWHLLHVAKPTNLPEHDDGGLFERTIGTLEKQAHSHCAKH